MTQTAKQEAPELQSALSSVAVVSYQQCEAEAASASFATTYTLHMYSSGVQKRGAQN